MTPNDRMLASCEAMRLTSRLTQVMAWLLVQKAVHAGEMTREDARAPEFRLAGKSVCAEAAPPVEGTLQPRLAELLERSLSLYLRVARLDAMQDGPQRRVREGGRSAPPAGCSKEPSPLLFTLGTPAQGPRAHMGQRKNGRTGWWS